MRMRGLRLEYHPFSLLERDVPEPLAAVVFSS
jgi:hypothetical protein